MIDIPVSSGIPEQEMRIVLDDSVCDIRIYWSEFDESIADGTGERVGRWYIDLSSDRFNIRGAALVCGCDLLELYGISELGSLLVVDIDGREEPSFDGLGGRWKLRYLDRSENEEIMRLTGYRS